MVTIGDFVAKDMVAGIVKRVRDELVAMIGRVASRERDEKVAARLREIASLFAETKL